MSQVSKWNDEELSRGCLAAAGGVTVGAALPYLILSRSPALVLVPSLIMVYLFTGRQTSLSAKPLAWQCE